MRGLERGMASVFPGMDPYLEMEFSSSDFRMTFVITLSEILNQSLPDHYVSRIGERCYPVDPDFELTEHQHQRLAEISSKRVNGSAKPIRPRVGNVRFVDPYKELYLDVIDLRSRDSVTVIEAISTVMKNGGRGQYLNRRQSLLEGSLNFLEIDVTRGGFRPLFSHRVNRNSYCYLVSRANDRPMTEVYEWTVRDPIPVISVPLRDGEPDAQLDLELVLATIRQRRRYDIDYAQELMGLRFEDEEHAWVTDRARHASEMRN
jgi:uncharacterized protein DUF4058